uniref:Uncharacterized protein n=1 Tax=Salix viminalis TaxID=40686 RepID=A0A6N2M2J2_SALVM
MGKNKRKQPPKAARGNRVPFFHGASTFANPVTATTSALVASHPFQLPYMTTLLLTHNEQAKFSQAHQLPHSTRHESKCITTRDVKIDETFHVLHTFW